MKHEEYDIFRGNVCHKLCQNQLGFIEEMLITNIIDEYWKKQEYFQAFYLVACLDYLSRLHHIPIYTKYNYIRQYKLEDMYYPTSIRIKATIMNVSIDDYCKDAIPEFLKYNIVEGDLFNVI